MNTRLFNHINGLAGSSHTLDRLMIFLAKYGAYAIPIFLLYLWFKRSEHDEDKAAALFLFVSAVVGIIFAWIIGSVYHHPRPFMIGIGKELLPHRPDTSFPSDHATVLSALAFALFFSGEALTGAAFLALDAVVGFARVFCGVHFPFDILGGFGVGFAAALAVWGSREWLSPAFQRVIALYRRIVPSTLH